jgi:hypothetical protein
MTLKTGRRGFFGLVGGAAIAGPSIAKNAVAELPKGLGAGLSSPVPPSGVSIGGSIGLAQKVGGGSSWHVAEIGRLRKYLSGDRSDEEKEEARQQRLYSRQTMISNHAAGLRSVAAWKKLDLYHRDMEALHEEIRRSQTQTRIWRLMKEMAS